MKHNKIVRIGVILLITLGLGFVDLTPETKKSIAPFFPDEINNAQINLGLDLQGGAQLDYKIDLRKVPEADQDIIVEGVQAVIERRVNSIGVSEPNIFESNVAGERHITVELAGINNLEEAKEIVGKTIQLEFKEQKTAEELNDPDHKSKIKTQVKALLDRAIAGEDFAVLGEEEMQANQGKVVYDKTEEAVDLDKAFPNIRFTDEELAEIRTLAPGSVYNKIIEGPNYFDLFKINEFSEEEKVVEAATEKIKTQKISYERIIFDNQPDPWKSTGLTGENFVRADADFGQNQIEPVVRLKFDEEGAQLFGEITGRNIQKPVAIFVGGTMVSNPTVESKIDNGEAIINGLRDIKEAQLIARELNTGAIPAPIILTGQYTIGSTLGQEALSTSLNAGIIGLILVAIYMILYYRAAGILAVIALSIYSIILLFLIKIALPLAAALLISICLYIWLIVKALNSKDSGWEKIISLAISTFGLFFFSFLLSTSVVLTLAGVAGVILSIGMAVDANILIFERMKEELKNGRPFSSAVEIGFARAWTSIRDSNFSSLITCGILFYVGTSIIKGFAFNLAAGVVVSMLTAITITKGFLHLFVGTKLSKNKAIWTPGASKTKEKTYKIIENSKIWFSLSGAAIALSLIALFTYGLRLGIDFTGGTSMVLKFEEQVTKEQITEAITSAEEKIKAGTTTPTPAEEKQPLALIPTANAQHNGPVMATTNAVEAEPEATETTPSITTNPTSETNTTELQPSDIPVEFGAPIVVESNEGHLIKLKHLSEETHESLKNELEADLGSFEEIRFNTIGPTVGSTMKYRAIVALAISLLAIVLYISFAFRKIPKEYSPWRFGVAAIIALTHDVIIAAGIFALLGHYLNVEIDILFVTALLTIIGFSVHDTIVVLDRLRENLRNKDSKEEFTHTTNKALTQTMARSINTSISTLITLLALYILGSQSIQWFVLALIIGTVVGTYSSIFTASPILVAWHKRTKQK